MIFYIRINRVKGHLVSPGRIQKRHHAWSLFEQSVLIMGLICCFHSYGLNERGNGSRNCTVGKTPKDRI